MAISSRECGLARASPKERQGLRPPRPWNAVRSRRASAAQVISTPLATPIPTESQRATTRGSSERSSSTSAQAAAIMPTLSTACMIPKTRVRS